jgi:hypothetical protein
LTVFNRLIQQTAADEIYQSVLVHTRLVISKLLRELLDEGNDIVITLYRWLETALTCARDNELVVSDTSSLTVCLDIRWIAQTITLVERIACVHQYILNAET